jgi:hypothetical protein
MLLFAKQDAWRPRQARKPILRSRGLSRTSTERASPQILGRLLRNPIYGPASRHKSFYGLGNRPTSLRIIYDHFGSFFFSMAAASSLPSGRYKGGPPNLTVTWLEQFCVPVSHTL